MISSQRDFENSSQQHHGVGTQVTQTFLFGEIKKTMRDSSSQIERFVAVRAAMVLARGIANVEQRKFRKGPTSAFMALEAPLQSNDQRAN